MDNQSSNLSLMKNIELRDLVRITYDLYKNGKIIFLLRFSNRVNLDSKPEIIAVIPQVLVGSSEIDIELSQLNEHDSKICQDFISLL